jgi:hypothetical protein
VTEILVPFDIYAKAPTIDIPAASRSQQNQNLPFPVSDCVLPLTSCQDIREGHDFVLFGQQSVGFFGEEVLSQQVDKGRV